MKSNNFLARLTALHVRPGMKPLWWIIPVWIFIDILGLCLFFWVISDFPRADGQLAMRADIVKIMTPIGFFLISGLFLPATHIVSVLVNWGRRRRKSVLGLRETQWWGILGAFLIVLVSLSFIASWAVGGSLRERAATAGYIECDGIFDRLERGRAYTTYALSADLCRQAGFKRSRIERDFDTPRPSG